MSQGNATFHERYLVNHITPAVRKGATVGATGWIAAHNALRVIAIIQVGKTDVDVNAKLQVADDANGTNAVDVAGAVITEVDASAEEADLVRTIDVETAKLAKPYVQLTITADDGTTGANVSGLLLMPVRHMPPAQPDSYDEQVVIAG